MCCYISFNLKFFNNNGSMLSTSKMGIFLAGNVFTISVVEIIELRTCVMVVMCNYAGHLLKVKTDGKLFNSFTKT